MRADWRFRRPGTVACRKFEQLPLPAPGVPSLSRWSPALASAQDFHALHRSSTSQSCCIALLCRGVPPHILESFVRYHCYIGFECIFLYFDDPAEAAALSNFAASEQRCIITACDAAYWKTRLAASEMVARSQTGEQRVFEDVALYWKQEVQSRQSLCVEDAIIRAVDRGLDWLLHIDADECFLPQTTHPVDFFALIPPTVEQVFFANVEVLPVAQQADRSATNSTPLNISNWLEQCVTFKVNPAHVEPREALEAVWGRIERARQHAIAGKHDCASESEQHQLRRPTSYFTAYASGKSAVRLPRRSSRSEADKTVPAAGAVLPVPFDVHKFLVPNGIGGWRVPRTLTCTDGLDHTDAPVVLHYPACGFNHWLSKYKLLGKFADHWWGRVPCRIPAHLQSRDVVQRQNRERCEQYYRWHIWGNVLGEHAVMEAHGLLRRITFVRSVLTEALSGSSMTDTREEWPH